jgi:predicted nuclease with TOPRIM domain
VAGGTRPAEATAGEDVYELRDRLEVVEREATRLDERVAELEDWCPDLDERLDDLEGEWAVAQEGLGTALVKGLTQDVLETESEAKERQNRKRRIRARINHRSSKEGPRG